jgi:hypothetical protein
VCSVGEIIALWNGLSGVFFGLKLIQKGIEKTQDVNNKDLQP